MQQQPSYSPPGRLDPRPAQPANQPNPAVALAVPAERRPLPRPLPAFCLQQPQAPGSHITLGAQPAQQAALSSSVVSVAAEGEAAGAAAGSAAATSLATAAPAPSAAAGGSAASPIGASAKVQIKGGIQGQAGAATLTDRASLASSDEQLQAALNRWGKWAVAAVQNPSMLTTNGDELALH